MSVVERWDRMDDLPEGSFTIRWDGYHGYRVSVPGLERATVVPADTYRGAVDAFAQERQAVLDAVNLYGDETLQKALDDIGWPADYRGAVGDA